MTKDEIKDSISMAEIVKRYGFSPNRAGFIRCPFHQGDKNASLKIYSKDFHCYGCGEHGDIFKFVMLMDGITFKQAFLSLGGHYDHPESERERQHLVRDQLIAKQNRERAERERKKKKQRIRYLSNEMRIYSTILQAWKPFSPEWCECMDGYERNSNEFECLWEEVNNGL